LTDDAYLYKVKAKTLQRYLDNTPEDELPEPSYAGLFKEYMVKKAEMIEAMSEVLENFEKFPGSSEDKFEKLELIKGAAGYESALDEDVLEMRTEELEEFEVKKEL